MSRPTEFYLVNDRPVKLVGTPDGGLDVLAYDWATGGFTRDMTYLSRVSQPGADVDQLTEQQFEDHVRQLKERP